MDRGARWCYSPWGCKKLDTTERLSTQWNGMQSNIFKILSCTYPQWSIRFSSVQSLIRVWLFETPWTAAHQASLSITNSWSFLKLMSIESGMPSWRVRHDLAAEQQLKGGEIKLLLKLIPTNFLLHCSGSYPFWQEGPVTNWGGWCFQNN